VKVMLQNRADQAGLLRRFLEEAQICGQLQHPGIVPVYELGRVNDRQPYFTMKLVKGQTLSELLPTRTAAVKQPGEDSPGRLRELPRLVAIFGQVCQAMAYAHDHGVIHRDL